MPIQTQNHEKPYLPICLVKPRRGHIIGMKPTGITLENRKHTIAGIVSGLIPDRNNYYLPGCVI
jgi:hypothetical protein